MGHPPSFPQPHQPQPAPYGHPPPLAQPAAAHGWPPAQHPPGPQPANFGLRIGAYAIDSVLAVLLFFVVYLGVGIGGAVTMSNLGSEGLAALMVLLALLLAALSSFCYFWLPTARSGQTPGKRILKIRVVDAATGQPPTKGSAAARTALLLLMNALPFGGVLNVVLAVIDEPRQRSIHDRAAATLVVTA
ncbi:RDD family protein [Thermobifida halotolerans]|uniref:RDD family protein n=1 Tax=Thermobifida halotolerans TaxID=483545 RepID=A0AA97LZR8_9ACTN|nr:RDD family protein [Thermobifida halotolerans]UOE20979.1 RDD family protein [Thermobifida halotolerans]